jgi:Major Facilitator Superfamily
LEDVSIWLEAALNFFSGGMMVAEMLFACVVTDITPREQLSTVFFYFNAIGQSTKVLGPAIAGGLMHLNAWFAVLAGLMALSATGAILLTVPETLQKRSDYIRLDSDEAEDHKRPTQLQQFRRTVIDAFKELGIVWTDWRLLFLALLYPFRMLGNAIGELLQQYVSNRYGWSLADAAFLYSIQGVAATIILFLVLPWSSDMIGKKFDLSVIQKNVVLTRISIFVLAIAYLIEGAAPTIALLIGGLLFETLGAGLPSTLRALAGVLVESKDSGRVFSVLAISEVLSTMIAFPATTSLFNVGLEKGGGIWLGLPYFVTAGTTAGAFALMSMLRFERR